METSLSWIATIATIAAATITASNLGSRITGYGFIVFTVGSISWFGLGVLTGQPALIWTNVALTFLNLFGIWRWLGRQAKIEDGGSRAQAKSRQLDSPTLFPASLLTKAKVIDTCGEPMATCIEAMLDSRTGRPVYLVIAEGGVAGVGETLRRMPWSEVYLNCDEFSTGIVPSELKHYDIVERDKWPAR